MFQSMGERMNKAFSIIISSYRKWRGYKRVEVSEFDLIVASGLTSGLVVTLGAVLYHTQEGWSYFESLYYCFITLSTIGFGDYVALQSGKALEVSKPLNKSFGTINRQGYLDKQVKANAVQTLLRLFSIMQPPSNTVEACNNLDGVNLYNKLRNLDLIQPFC